MENSNKNMRNSVIVTIIIAALGFGYWYYTQNAGPLPLAAGDSIESWNFQGSHKDGGANEKKANDEIARLTAMIGDAEVEPPDYQVYVGIANQYALLGDGKPTYEYLGKALEIDAEKTGLAWHNMGTLMERLGAMNTARIAYKKAVDAQSVIEAYHTAYIKFLLKNPDGVEIEDAFFRAEEQFGENYPSIMQLRVEWLESQGKKEEADDLRKKINEMISGS